MLVKDYEYKYWRGNGTIYFDYDFEHGVAVDNCTVEVNNGPIQVRPYTILLSSGPYGFLTDRDLTLDYATSKLEAYEFGYFSVQFVLDECPNRRVAYLARRGKNKRVKMKNFHRAVKLVEEKFKTERFKS